MVVGEGLLRGGDMVEVVGMRDARARTMGVCWFATFLWIAGIFLLVLILLRSTVVQLKLVFEYLGLLFSSCLMVVIGCRPEELRIPFERFGLVRDVYIPKDYYTG